jgi:hypothetical protein
LHYLFRSKGASNLLVTFHGALNRNPSSPTGLTPLPVFRGHDWELEGVDILCLSDGLLAVYSKQQLALSWFLSTPRHQFFPLYLELIDSFLKRGYDKVIFAGSSGGGHISVRCASYFGKSAAIFNAQIYLQKHHYYPHFVRIAGEPLDHDLQAYIRQHGQPEHLYIYANKNDVHHYKEQALPFVQFMNNEYPRHCTATFFAEKQEGKDVHVVYTPNNTLLRKTLLKTFGIIPLL